MLTLGSGVIAALLAIAIEGLPVVLGQLMPPSAPQQINASTLFPTPGPQHREVDVEDPPSRERESSAPPASSPRPSPSRPPRSPQPTPSPDN